MEKTMRSFTRLLGGIALAAAATAATAAPAIAGGGGGLPANETYVNVSAQVIADCTVSVLAQPATY